MQVSRTQSLLSPFQLSVAGKLGLVTLGVRSRRLCLRHNSLDYDVFGSNSKAFVARHYDYYWELWHKLKKAIA